VGFSRILIRPLILMTFEVSSKRFGCLLFAVALLLAPISRVIWMLMVGPSWWYAYHGDGETGRSADRIVDWAWILALVLAIAAPIFPRIGLRRKLSFSFLAAAGVCIAFYLSGFLVLFIYGV
jgi:hypothetical protein